MPRDHRRRTAASLVAGLLLAIAAGCATTREEEAFCHVRQDRRPLGRRFERFGELLRSAPGAVAHDTTWHLDSLGDKMGRIGRILAQDAGDTVENAAELAAWPIVDAKRHERSLTRTIGGVTSKWYEDFVCFFDRAWYAMKMLE